MAHFRKVSPAEVTFLATDTAQQSPFVNQFFLEGNGNIKLEDWQAAVRKACDANPGIKVKLKGRWGWRYWDDDQAYPEVKIYESDWHADTSFDSHLTDTPLSQPINARDNAQPSVSIIKLKNPLGGINTRIMFRIHHGVCDGAAMMHWINDIMRALRNEPLIGSSGTGSELDVVANTEAPPPETQGGDCIPIIAETVGKTNDDEQDGCEWIKFRWESKNNKILANLIIILNNIARSQTPKPKDSEGRVIFRISSDLRRYLSKDEKAKVHCTNLSGAFDLEVFPDNDVETIHKRVIGAMRKKLDLSLYPKGIKIAPWLPDFLYRPNKKVIANMRQQERYGMTGMIAHLGKIEVSDYSYSDFQCSGFYAIPIPLNDRSVYIALFIDDFTSGPSEKGGTNFVLSMPRALSDKAGMTNLIEQIKSALAPL